MAQEADDDNDVPMDTKHIEITAPTATATAPEETSNNTAADKEPSDQPMADEAKAKADDDEKKSPALLRPSTIGMNPIDLVQSAMGDYLNEMSAADLKASELYEAHQQRQQQLMRQFVADSLRLMHEFNTSLDPIHAVLNRLKAPLEQVLLDQFVSIPCDDLEAMTKAKGGTAHRGMGMGRMGSTWGVSHHQFGYNQRRNISENPHLSYIDLGAEIKSLKSRQPSQAQPTQPSQPADDDPQSREPSQDAPMTDKETSNQPQPQSPQCDASDQYTQAILGYLSDTNNITESQQSQVLGFFTKINAERQRLRQEQEAKIMREQQEAAQREQRVAAAVMLQSVVPWLELPQATIIVAMKSDNVEQATNYCMSSDPMEIYSAINDYKQKHPETSSSANPSDPTSLGDLSSLGDLERQTSLGRSTLDKRVLNRNRSTGLAKCVTFRCASISDDGQVSLRAVLDRNNIPLDPAAAKVMTISMPELVKCAGLKLESPEMVKAACSSRVMRVMFQCLQDANSHRSEFLPISVTPRCRDTEYEFRFDERTPVDDQCLSSVTHRMDGAVLFQGVFDDGKGLSLVGAALNHPIDIYAEVMDEVTHNIVAIILENDLRDNVVVDVCNLSFTDRTLADVIADSAKELAEADAAGNKISYRIVVKDERIIGVLTRLGSEIKEMPYIEHSWLKEGELVSVPSQGMLGILRTVPTGLIVTNDPHREKLASKKTSTYERNPLSEIKCKHVADLDGYVDVDVFRVGDGQWRQMGDPLRQAFAVIDLKRADEEEQGIWMSMQQQAEDESKQREMGQVKEGQGRMRELLESVEREVKGIKGWKKGGDGRRTPKEMLDAATKSVEEARALLGKMKGVEEMGDEERKFVDEVEKEISAWSRELRALRIEVRMM